MIVLLALPAALEAKMKEVILPKPKATQMILDDCIKQRRSIRSYKKDDLTVEQLSNLLWSMQGITEPTWKFRAAPSGGATYPLEVLVAKKDGLFRYIPLGHKLVKLTDKDKRNDLSSAAWDQDFIGEAPVVFILTAIYPRITQRYGERGIRYAHMEIGHVAENCHLMAVALGLGSVPVGAFNDEKVKKLLGLPEDEEPLYIVPVGYPK